MARNNYSPVTLDEITYFFDGEGGFNVVDAQERLSSYAYPTSTYAVNARRSPAKTAKDMVLKEREAVASLGRNRFFAEAYDRTCSKLAELSG